MLGSVAMAIYRAGLPADAPQTARETLGGAVTAGDPVLADAARTAFVTGLTATSAIGAVLGLALAATAAVALRPARADGDAHAADASPTSAPAGDPADVACDGAAPELCRC